MSSLCSNQYLMMAIRHTEAVRDFARQQAALVDLFASQHMKHFNR